LHKEHKKRRCKGRDGGREKDKGKTLKSEKKEGNRSDERRGEEDRV